MHDVGNQLASEAKRRHFLQRINYQFKISCLISFFLSLEAFGFYFLFSSSEIDNDSVGLWMVAALLEKKKDKSGKFLFAIFAVKRPKHART